LKHGGIEKVVFNAFAAFVEVLWMDDVVLNPKNGNGGTNRDSTRAAGR